MTTGRSKKLAFVKDTDRFSKVEGDRQLFYLAGVRKALKRELTDDEYDVGLCMWTFAKIDSVMHK